MSEPKSFNNRKLMDWQNQFLTDTFEGFVKKFFENTKLETVYHSQLHYMNRRVIVANIRKNVNAEIKLVDNGTMGEYNCLVVTIIHKDNSKIAGQTFSFKDWLEVPGNHNRAIMVEHCGKDWYLDGPTPESVKTLAAKITEYILLYS